MRRSDETRVRTSDASGVIILGLSFAPSRAISFVDNRRGQQPSDARKHFERLSEPPCVNDTAALEIPATRFPSRGQRILVETTTIPRAAPRVRLDIVRADRAESSAELINHVRSARVGGQAAQVIPSPVCNEEGKAIGCAVPEGVGGDFKRQRGLPHSILVLHRHSASLTQHSHPTVPNRCFWSFGNARRVTTSNESRVSTSNVSHMRTSHASVVTRPHSSLVTYPHQ